MTGFYGIATLSMFVTHREILEKSSVPHLSAILCLGQVGHRIPYHIVLIY